MSTAPLHDNATPTPHRTVLRALRNEIQATDANPNGYGGIEAMCAALADSLVTSGHHVVTIGPGPRGTGAAHICTYDVPPSNRIGDRWPEAVHAAEVAQILADRDVDIIHAHSMMGPLSAASRPKLGPDVEWLGEVFAADKWALLGEAAALVFPITWDEPFGMVMIEAMATGTPVIGIRRGSVPEVVDQGVTGFVCADLDEMVTALGELETIDPAACRHDVRARFDIRHTVAGYEAAYRSVRDSWLAESPVTAPLVS